MAALLTGVDPSNAARVRSSSCRRSISVRARSDGGPSWKACSVTWWKASNSSTVMGRMG